MKFKINVIHMIVKLKLFQLYAIIELFDDYESII